jgi:antitoxin (DNA-binding transcriptional repressor) of toxin-antitoxin stability system
MRTDTRPIQITIADLQADAEGIIRNLPKPGEAVIVSSSGEVIAMLATAVSGSPLTVEQVAEIRQAFADAEKEDPSEWTDHDDFMRELDEDERKRDDP